MIIADENLEQYWINLLRKKGIEVFSIRENHPGMTDLEIIEFSKNKKGVLITEDKDFGELVFAYAIQSFSIIFLRYDQPNYQSVEQNLLQAIGLIEDNSQAIFITVTADKIRIRKL
jgi:predicted nuclease of predicted toxin-antitoxin system